MKITCITSNLPRHNYLINSLADIRCKLFVIQECQSYFPGLINDIHYKINDINEKYFQKVNNEQKFFFEKHNGIFPNNLMIKSLSFNELNFFNLKDLKDYLNSDLYIVFGSSYLKGALVDFLIKKKAINIHMGLSPFYRGTDCNFWSIHDRNFHLVGATVHRLSKGLDNGDILFHSLPKFYSNPMRFNMSSVKAVIDNLVRLIKNNKIMSLKTKKQDKNLQIRYTTKKDFNHDAIKEFYKIKKLSKIKYDKKKYINPQF